MEQADLSPFFRAKSVGIIGASETGTGASVFSNLKSMGFPAESIYLVNPRRETVFGHRCYNSISSLPVAPEVVFIATRADIAVASIKDCADRGIRAGIIFAEGFTESGEAGRALQQKLAEVAQNTNFLVCGPNCMGFAVPSHHLGLWALNLPKEIRPGNIGAIFQSSGMLNLFFDLVTKRGRGFSIAVSAGNEAVVDASEYLNYIASDPDTEVIIMYLEGLKNARTFVEALDKARSNNKTILAIRAGRSELARQNLIAHTGKLISSSTALDSLLKQKGVILLNNYDELLETALLFSALGSPKKELKQAIGLITNSGGDATFLADLCERLHIPLPKLSPEIRTQIANKLQKSTLIGNPLDITDFHPGFYESMDAFLGEPSFDIAGCRLILPNKPNEELKEEYSRVNSLAKSHGKIMVFLSRATEYFDKEWFDFFSSINAPFVLEYEKALKALSLYLDASKKTAVVEPVQSYPRFLTPSLENLVSESPAGVLSFETSQELASAYQIPVPQSKVAADSKGAAQIASQIGCPVALKVVSSQFVHKTEAGVVALGIKTPSEAELVVERIISEAKRSNPAATIDGVLVQRMVEGGVAEVIIGTSRDPQLGSIIVFGLGGIFVEVLRDVATRVAPISLDDARQMIEELKGKQILMGFRGKPLADLNALAETIWKVSRLALDLNTISEFEINPLVVLPKGKGVSAIDIRAVKSST